MIIGRGLSHVYALASDIVYIFLPVRFLLFILFTLRLARERIDKTDFSNADWLDS